MKKFCRVSISLTVILFISSDLYATIRRVPANYSTIQSAVNSSQDGDTVLLANGVYHERAQINDRELTIAGAFLFSNDTNDIAQIEWTIPDSLRGDSTLPRNMLQIHHSNFIRIIGLTFRSGLGTFYFDPFINRTRRFGGGILADSSNLFIDFCRITNCSAEYGGGVANLMGNFHFSNSTVDSCYGYYVLRAGGGVYARCDTISIHSSRFIRNYHEYWLGGIALSALQYGELSDSYILLNGSFETIGGGGVDNFNHINNNVVSGNQSHTHAGLEISSSRSTTPVTRIFEGNEVSNNYAIAGDGSGIFFNVTDSSRWELRDNKFLNNSAGNINMVSHGGAICFQFGNYFLLHNSFIGNFGGQGSAILARQRQFIRADSNEFINNSGGKAVFVWLSAVIQMSNSNFINNGVGLVQGEHSTGNSAINCYWGDPTGPRTSSNPFGTGDSLGDSIAFRPWLEVPVNLPTSVEENHLSFVPTSNLLMNVIPNPFNPTTTITFSLPHRSETELSLFDLSGRQVRTLVHGEQSAGIHRTVFDGSMLATGTYFVRLRVGNDTQVKKVVLIK